MTETEKIKKYQVCIIGAGVSGLAAAHRLIERKVDNIIIIEAQNRIGGRIRTENHGEFWMYLINTNIIYEYSLILF